MLRKLIFFAFTSGLVKKAFMHFRTKSQPASATATAGTKPTVRRRAGT